VEAFGGVARGGLSVGELGWGGWWGVGRRTCRRGRARLREGEGWVCVRRLRRGGVGLEGLGVGCKRVRHDRVLRETGGVAGAKP